MGGLGACHIIKVGETCRTHEASTRLLPELWDQRRLMAWHGAWTRHGGVRLGGGPPEREASQRSGYNRPSHSLQRSICRPMFLDTALLCCWPSRAPSGYGSRGIQYLASAGRRCCCSSTLSIRCRAASANSTALCTSASRTSRGSPRLGGGRRPAYTAAHHEAFWGREPGRVSTASAAAFWNHSRFLVAPCAGTQGRKRIDPTVPYHGGGTPLVLSGSEDDAVSSLAVPPQHSPEP
ncbi:hypothetical protein BU16DRAFT_589739 [Lophium mytilinum]|uniref:Uncharacterized protein n=1 Tax=Lophium mytilinum TaxID=390894 RepID=A0A6A6QR86_9PEZI|nr:hypothetical protein BU16DRAFT_589739 [Lophium mytilinum]